MVSISIIGIGATDGDITGPIFGIDVGGQRRKVRVFGDFSTEILGKNNIVWHTWLINMLNSFVDRFLVPAEYWAWRRVVSHSW